MDQDQLLAALDIIYDELGAPVLLKTSEANIKHYTINGYLASGDIMQRRSVYYFVVDEGGPGEAAYYAGRQPEQPPPQSQFLTDVTTFIEAAIAAGTIEAAFLTAADEQKEIAVAVAYRQVNSLLQKDEAIFWRDGVGDIQIRVVGS